MNYQICYQKNLIKTSSSLIIEDRISILFLLRDHHYKTTYSGHEFYSTMPGYKIYHISLFPKSNVICSEVGGKIQPIIFGIPFSFLMGSRNNPSNVKIRRLSCPLLCVVAIFAAALLPAGRCYTALELRLGH